VGAEGADYFLVYAKTDKYYVKKFEAEMDKAEIKDPPIGPMILPDYTPEEVKGRQWNSPAI